MAPPRQSGPARRARRGVRRPEPRLPRHPPPDRGARPGSTSWPGPAPTYDATAGAAGRVVPRRGLRRRAGRRGAVGGLGRGRARAAGAGARSSPRWPGWSGSPRPTSPTTPTPTAARSPTPTWRSWPRRGTATTSTSRRCGASTPTCPTTSSTPGRAAVLGALADKPHLFHTAYAREHWEAPARANLERELASWPGEFHRVPGETHAPPLILQRGGPDSPGTR